MSEAMVVLGVTETVQGDILKERLYVRDVMGNGIISIWIWWIPEHLKGRKQIARFPEFVFVYL